MSDIFTRIGHALDDYDSVKGGNVCIPNGPMNCDKMTADMVPSFDKAVASSKYMRDINEGRFCKESGGFVDCGGFRTQMTPYLSKVFSDALDNQRFLNDLKKGKICKEDGGQFDCKAMTSSLMKSVKSIKILGMPVWLVVLLALLLIIAICVGSTTLFTWLALRPRSRGRQ